MIRPNGALGAARAATVEAVTLLALVTGASAGQAAVSDSIPRSEAVWLPLPVEEIDRPERLERESGGSSALSLRCDVKGGRVLLRRAAAAHVRGACRVDVEAALDAAGRAAFALAASRERFQIAAGRVGIREGPTLLEEWIGSRRHSSRIPPPAMRASSFEPAGASSPSIEGVGLRQEAAAGGAAWGVWCVAGRFVENHEYRSRTAALGARFGRNGSAAHLAAGFLRDVGPSATRAAVSIGWTARRSGAGVLPRGAAAELLFAPRGVSTLFSAWGAAGPLEAACRWRRRAGEARATAGEATVEGGPRDARVRFRVSGGPSGASGSVSRVELECRLGTPVPAALRGGETRWDQAPPVGPAEAVVKRERFWVLEATVARSNRRTLAILASRRERSLPSGWREGSGFGGRLGMASRRGQLEILIQATRAAAGGSAWGSAFYAAGPVALRSWSRPGIWAAARGSLRFGRWTAGGVVESREDDAGGGTTAASFWIQRTLPAAAR